MRIWVVFSSLTVYLAVGVSVRIEKKSGAEQYHNVSSITSIYHTQITEADQFSVVLTLPENRRGSSVARRIIQEVSYLYATYGFQSASVLLRHSVWPLVVHNYTHEVKLGALFITKKGSYLSAMGFGPFWIGLFRESTLIASGQFLGHSVDLDSRVILRGTSIKLPHSFVVGLPHQKWYVKANDFVVVGRSDLPEIRYVVQQVMAAHRAVTSSIDDIIDSILMKFPWSKYEPRRVFAAMKIE